jgi:restriction system protein
LQSTTRQIANDLGRAMASAHGRGIRGRLAAWAGRLVQRREPAPAPPVGPAVIKGMGWQRFEQLVAEGFRHRGYSVSETGGGGGRTVDMVLTRGHDRFLVDCKPWRVEVVALAPLRALAEQVRERGAAGGFVLSSGDYTPEARRFADDHQLQLIDGRGLRELLHSGEEKTQPLVARRAGPFLDTTLPPSAWRWRAHPCPLCGGPMVETERKGERLLGCSHHPLCSGTRPLP